MITIKHSKKKKSKASLSEKTTPTANVTAYGKRRRIHLLCQPRTSKAQGVVNFYSFATSYTENGKNQKKILYRLGVLSPDEVARYKLLLSVLNKDLPIESVINKYQLRLKEVINYLDVLALSSLWKKLGFEKIFHDSSSSKKVSSEAVARILTINRLLSPTSKIKTIDWFNSTYLAEIMNIDPSKYDKNKIFRELTQIHKCKPSLERLFSRISKEERGEEFEVYYFDGSTSWFEGSKCPLAKSYKEKTRGFFPKVVGLMLVTDNQGYPVAWEIVEGNKKESVEFKNFLKRLSDELGITNVTYCFDRGVASEENFELIGEENKFISGILSAQIKEVFDLDKFQITRNKILKKISNPETVSEKSRRIVDIDGFLSYDDKHFFRDLNIIEGYRYIVSFNHEIYLKEIEDRESNIAKALIAVNEKNQELFNAKKDRDYNVTERILLDIFDTHNVKGIFSYTLLPIITKSKAQSFEIKCSLNQDKIEEKALTSGLFIYKTNHISKKDKDKYEVSAEDVVAHYKGKYIIENAFREMKSFIDIRPFFVWTEEHVKAHYDITIAAYFINNYIARKLSKFSVSIRDFYALLQRYAQISKQTDSNQTTICTMKEIPDELKLYFKELGIEEINSPTTHSNLSVF